MKTGTLNIVFAGLLLAVFAAVAVAMCSNSAPVSLSLFATSGVLIVAAGGVSALIEMSPMERFDILERLPSLRTCGKWAMDAAILAGIGYVIWRDIAS